MFPLLPIVLGGAVLLAWRRAQSPSKTPTAEQKIVFDNAVVAEVKPEKLQTLAEAFKEEGLPDQAKILETRAAWYSAPPEEKQARRDAFRVGMASQEPDKVEALADAFEQQVALGAASDLRKYAAGLRAGVMQPAKKPMGVASPDTPLSRMQAAAPQTQMAETPVSRLPKLQPSQRPIVPRPTSTQTAEAKREQKEGRTPGVNKRERL